MLCDALDSANAEEAQVVLVEREGGRVVEEPSKFCFQMSTVLAPAGTDATAAEYKFRAVRRNLGVITGKGRRACNGLWWEVGGNGSSAGFHGPAGHGRSWPAISTRWPHTSGPTARKPPSI